MEELVTFLAKSLVEKPEDVKVLNDGETDGILTLKLTVAKEDMGRVIGKQGRIAKAIRAIVKSVAIREGKRVNVEIVDSL